MKKNIVLIGGGHGLSNLVKGFKNEDIDLNIVVSSTDDGGHTGKIRDEFDLVAVGDLRMVLNELIGDSSSLKEFFNYRFESIHGVKGVSLGNLIITSLLEKYGDIDKVINYFKEKEGIRPNVYLSSNNPLSLCAQCADGSVVKGESLIGESNLDIKKLSVNKKAFCNETMLEKIKSADTIVLSPGSLYTSVGSVLCIDEIKSAICNSKASIVYVCNIMTQDGETRNFSVKEHVDALEGIVERKIDRVIVNDGKISKDILTRYKEENGFVVECKKVETNYELYNLVEIIDGKVRHNSEVTKKIILKQ